MANVLVQESSLQAIAAAIRAKNGSAHTYTPAGMAAAISSISAEGGSNATLVEKTINANGEYNPAEDGADGYSVVTVNVPESQPILGTKQITSNGSYDAEDDALDGYSGVIVNVPASASASLGTKQITANGNYSASSDGLDGFSSVNVDVPTPVLGSKSITENGTYDPADDSFDGYDSVVVDVPLWMRPVAFDLDTGYVSGNVWTLGGSSVSYSDVYEVQSGHNYLLMLGSTVGSRFRAVFTYENTVTSTANITGTGIVNKTSPTAGAYTCFTAPGDGYITITKDNAGLAGIMTYVADVTTD